MPTVVDLFCGAGGLTEGLDSADFRTVFAADVDEMAVKTFSTNHPGVPVRVADVSRMQGKHILQVAGLERGDLDVLAGGPPCQGFSLAGRRLPDDPKNRLFIEFLRLAGELEPRVILMENVPGIQSMQSGRVVDAITTMVNDLGYNVVTDVLNAAEYGVPQQRRRFIMLAFQDDRPLLPAPTHTSSREQAEALWQLPLTPTVAEALDDLPSISQGEGAESLEHPGNYTHEYQKERQGRRSPGKIFNHRATRHSDRITTRYSLIPPGCDNSVVPAEHRTKKINVFRLHPESEARTVTCNFRTDLLHPRLPRGLTVREAARLQSFDDDYQFFGNLTRKARWVTQDDQVGNAVPPLLARAIGMEIARYLQRKKG